MTVDKEAGKYYTREAKVWQEKDFFSYNYFKYNYNSFSICDRENALSGDMVDVGSGS